MTCVKVACFMEMKVRLIAAADHCEGLGDVH